MHKINKKGGLIESPIVLWAIGILVVILLLWIMLGPEKLMATAKDSIFTFGIGKIPGEEHPEIPGDGALTVEVDMSGQCANIEMPIGETITSNDVCHALGFGDCAYASGKVNFFGKDDCPWLYMFAYHDDISLCNTKFSESIGEKSVKVENLQCYKLK